MSVEMWNCHSWPLDVSRNVKLPLLTTICLLYIYICIVEDLAIKLICCSKDGGVYPSFSVNDNIEQWRDHSILCQCWRGGISAFECQWQHWTVKRSLCPLLVLTGGYICLWVSMTTLNSEEITLSSDSVEWGVYLPLSLNDNIEQWRDHSVLCYVDQGGISTFECHWQHWTVKRSHCPLIVLMGGGEYLPLSVNDNIEQWRDHSLLW